MSLKPKKKIFKPFEILDVICPKKRNACYIFLFENDPVFFIIVMILLTEYIYLISQNLKSGTSLWNPGVFPPALIAFEGQVHPIDSLTLVTNLGYRYQSDKLSKERLEAAAVIHFSGPAKPWLEIGFPEVRSLWSRYVNFSNKFIRRCRITR